MPIKEFNCTKCGKSSSRSLKEYNRTIKKTGIGFCSRECANAARSVVKTEKVCKCGELAVNKAGKCQQCWREYYKCWYAKNKKQHLAGVKKTRSLRIKDRRNRLLEYLNAHPCVDCGESDPVVLDFDHVRGRKRSDVTKMIYTSCWQTISEEIEKCEIRCANCHRRRTAKQNGSYKMDS